MDRILDALSRGGYGRGARLIDFMAEDGVVGEYKGSQAREVLITMEEWARRRIGRAGSVRETGTGRPEPASPATLRASGEMTRATPSLRRLALPGPKMGWACIPADFRHI
jgi:hypothetical protein